MMPDKNSITEDFRRLLNEIKNGGKGNDTDLLHSLLHKSFEGLAYTEPRKAQAILTDFEGEMKFNNYLSEEEARKIVSEMVFDSNDKKGTTPWEADRLFNDMKISKADAEDMGSEDFIDDETCYSDVQPYYNRWALWATMNKYYADNYYALKKWVEENGRVPDFQRACYDFAIEQLMDQDKPHWVRWYFGLSK